MRVSRQIFDTKNTDRVSLWYRHGNYREIPTNTDQKIPIRDATLTNTLTWVYTNTLMWELIGTVTWVYTNTITWELNRYGPDRTGPD